MKQSFLIYYDYKEKFDALSDAELRELLNAVFCYEMNGISPQFSGALAMAWLFIKDNLNRDKDSYDKRCNANRLNGEKGGRKKEKPKEPNGFFDNPIEPNESENNPTEPKEPDNDNDNDNDIKKENIQKKKNSSVILTEELLHTTLQESFKDKDVINAFLAFADMRKAKGKKDKIPTLHALELLISALRKHSADKETALAVLNQSIERNYNGLFPVSGKSRASPPPKEPDYNLARMEDYE